MSHILLVDDDEDSLYATAKTLEAAGFKVMTARDYRQALPIISGAEPLDLLITDIVMPNRVNGFALARMATMRRRDLKVIYITAHDKVPTHEAAGPVLLKPLGDVALLAAVRQELDRRDVTARDGGPDSRASR